MLKRTLTPEWLPDSENKNSTEDLGNSRLSKSLDRGTFQGKVISPLLWLTAVNSILIDIYNKNFKVIAYVDDIGTENISGHLK